MFLKSVAVAVGGCGFGCDDGCGCEVVDAVCGMFYDEVGGFGCGFAVSVWREIGSDR